LAIDRKISRVVVEHKDRLARFCFGVFEVFFKSHGVEIEWAENVLPKSYESELVEDMISLMSSFSARIYGKRSAENQRKKKEAKGADQASV
jgi:predicted site-specific integrase-resolvase